MNTKPQQILLAYCGDDFTGSTDALEFLSKAGIKAVLFITPPTPEQLFRYTGLQAFGVAGKTRSMGPQEMEAELRPAFAALRRSGAPHVHYKVCSTFDSSPHIGSIGKAIETGAEIFASPFVPLLVAAPALGRYCAFGNLFARLGIGSKGAIYRLDRHPSMSSHPVTPAHESDLRLHLSHQTKKRIGLMDILQIMQPESEAKETLEKIIQEGAEIVLFDAIYESQMAGIGALLDGYASTEQPLFSVGSSGIEMALGNYWSSQGLLQQVQSWPDPGKADAILVVSGSCSPVTSAQITWALSHGFADIALDTKAIAEGHPGILEQVAERAIALLKEGRSIILHTSRGTNDSRIEKTSVIFTRKGWNPADTAQVYGTALGRIVKTVAAQTPVQRLVIAGGDTSSFVGRELGIEAIEMIAPLSPGAPLCKAYAPGSPVDGMQINFKGGQVGGEDYFGRVLEGRGYL